MTNRVVVHGLLGFDISGRTEFTSEDVVGLNMRNCGLRARLLSDGEGEGREGSSEVAGFLGESLVGLS